MKKLVKTLVLLLLIGLIYKYHNDIMKFIMINIVYKDETIIKESNEYEKDADWSYVKRTDNFNPKNKQDLLNIFYTALNKGWDELTFYCPTDYENCIDDVNEITTNQNTLSYVNNFVSTYNSYSKIYVNMNSFGRVNITIQKIYTDSMINEINKKVDEIYNSLITDNMTDTEKIKVIHDYITNNTIYDEERSNDIKSGKNIDTVHNSNTAYGTLFNGKAICGGYTDTMALFLDKIGLPNFKIASQNHIWNVVYIDGAWKHLDLTWDDPVVNTGEHIVTYNYYLISTDELKKKEDNQHNYNTDIFSEAK